jgi:hypothetical protein
MSHSLRQRAIVFWQNALSWQARRAPIIGRMLKPLAMQLGWRCSSAVRDATRANARRIFGPGVTMGQIHRYTAGLLSSFFDFVCDVGRCATLSDGEQREQIEAIEGDAA